MKRKYSSEQYFKLVKNLYNLNYDTNSYVSLSKKITIICDIHGPYKIKADIHLDKGRSCYKCNSKYKSDTQDFIKKANVIHNNSYNYSKVDYKNQTAPVTIICKNNHEFKQSPKVHLRGNGCKKCSYEKSKLTSKQFIKKAIKIYNKRFTYKNLNYIDSLTNIVVTCKVHGDFSVSPKSFIYQNKNCTKCNVYNNVKLTNAEYIAKANTIHNNKYTYENINYTGKDNKIEINCHKHGSFFKNAASHLKGFGCPNCLNYNKIYTSKEYFDLAKINHNNKYTYDESSFKNLRSKIIIFCKKHGQFTQQAGRHLERDCPRCKNNISKKETLWLNSLNIPEIYRNYNLKLGSIYKNVDAYDPNTNTVYEFHGDFWHGNPKVYKSDHINKVTKKTFGEMYKKSKAKDELIISFGFNLIIMWESDFKN